MLRLPRHVAHDVVKLALSEMGQILFQPPRKIARRSVMGPAMTALLPLLNGAAAKDAILIDPEILLASGIGDEFAAPPVREDQGLLPCFKGEPGKPRPQGVENELQYRRGYSGSCRGRAHVRKG